MTWKCAGSPLVSVMIAAALPPVNSNILFILFIADISGFSGRDIM